MDNNYDQPDPFDREAEAAMVSGDPYPRNGAEYDWHYETMMMERESDE